MGGLISTKLLLEKTEQKNWKGVILSGPLIKADPNVANPMVIEIGRFLNKYLPKLPIGDAINPTDVSKSKKIQDEYKIDEKTYHGRIRVNTGNQILNTIDQVNENFSKIEIPTLCKQIFK
jgi:alpha-beta hydrolase superfamily lysophospholipase